MCSFICRNAFSTYQSPVQFVCQWVNPHAALNYDFDRFRPLFLQNLSGENRIDHQLSLQLQRAQEVPKLFLTAKYAKLGVIYYGTIRKIRQRRPRYCPSCLSSPDPYFRLTWKVSIVYGCLLCGCFLRDECPHCNSPVQIMRQPEFHRNGENLLGRCVFCDGSLSACRIVALSAEDHTYLECVRRMLEFTGGMQREAQSLSLLLDLANFLCRMEQVPAAARNALGIGWNGSFMELSPEKLAPICRTSLTWSQSFHKITSELNAELNLRRNYWDGQVNMENSIFL